MDQKFDQVLQEVKKSYTALQREWEWLQKELKKPQNKDIPVFKEKGGNDVVYVTKQDLACLATEITQLKQNLSTVLDQSYQQSQLTIQTLKNDNHMLKEQFKVMAQECEQWKTKYNNAVGDTQTEKQECLKLRCEVQSLTQELSQQTEYCASLGNACCTLLWRVSRSEDTVQAILAGTKVDEFLSLVSSTLQSYISAYRDDWPQEGTEENQFILALCGIVTNIAASAYGRDYLVTNKYSQEVIDTFISVLQDAPVKKSARMKNLIMMCLYNISINKKGIKCLTSRNDLVPLIGWLLQGEDDKELKLNCLRLIQSSLFEQDNISIIHQVAEVIPESYLADLSKDIDAETREIALELMSDLQQIAITN